MNLNAKSILVAAVLLASGRAALAQDGLNNILRASTNSKPTFAVFDVRGGTTSVDALEVAVSSAFKKHYDGIKAVQQMAPYPLPVGAPRMTFQQVGSAVGPISVPDCPGASAVITSSDRTMAKYGEVSVLQGCVFAYRDGYRVNVYALFVQKSGGTDTNVLGAMLGRVVTNAIGIGDSGKFIGETIDDIEARLVAIAPQVTLVELQPMRNGKSIAADPAPAAQPGALGVPATSSGVAAQAMPAELVGVQARIAAMLRQQQPATGAQPAAPLATGGSAAGQALQARKDLSAMGLSYYSQEQFVEAARRGDKLACELFVRAASVKADKPDKTGVTPLQAAKSADLKGFLLSSGQ
ncbi:MAG: hypothetical protein JWP59_4038 [Massilia sp.]|jgi:hypothetical protein|nr:hypothetical protein [Massilia sp.]